MATKKKTAKKTTPKPKHLHLTFSNGAVELLIKEKADLIAIRDQLVAMKLGKAKKK